MSKHDGTGTSTNRNCNYQTELVLQPIQSKFDCFWETLKTLKSSFIGFTKRENMSVVSFFNTPFKFQSLMDMPMPQTEALLKYFFQSKFTMGLPAIV